MLDDDVLKALNEQDWETIIPNLMIHEKYRLYGKSVPGEFAEGDFVQEAYIRIYDGERKWNPNQAPDLLKYMKGVIDSLISAAIKSKNNKLFQLDLGKFDVSSNEDLYESLIGVELYDEILQDIQNDTDLGLLFLCITDCGKTKPEEIQKELEWEKSKINNLKRKLQRRVIKLLEKRANN